MTLALRRFGAGPRQVVALHCSLAHGGTWAGVAEALPGTAFLAPDMLSHGRSPDWDVAGDFGDAATAAVEEILPPGPIDLIGHSFGAVVALRLALAAPGRLRSLTLVEPVLFAAARRAGDPAMTAYDRDHAPVLAALARGDLRGAAAAFHAAWGTGSDFAALHPEQADYISGRIHLIGAAAPMLEGDRAGLLAPGGLESLDLPVLLIEGADSPPVMGAIQSALARRLPRAARAVVPGAAHMAPITHPREVAALLAQHWRP